MTSVYHEQAAEQKLRDECDIPESWTATIWESSVRFIGETGAVSRAIAEKYGIGDWMGISQMIIGATTPMLIPEHCRMFAFKPPEGHVAEGRSFLLTATKRDLEMGTEKYLSRLDEGQLLYAQDAISDLLSAKKNEQKRTVWRVSDDWVCLGNFREDDYLGAVEFMAAKAKEKCVSEPNDRLRHKSLQIGIYPERVPESEYESFFE
ncbi:hypothetical protein AWR38_01305 [Idiomarina sp. WRN-38]|nr:hypothetical protein AUR68_01300 [Idiomarina sp. H105]OAE96062.1 hypothetical protein AWR38_01305 [Idiomarina sp. WRN-38]